MKMKFLMSLIVNVALGSSVLAQHSDKREIKELQIGDEVPQNMVMGKVINHKLKTVKFSDFKGKLLIIDFWSTTCGDCVGSLPKMDSLQKRFGDRVAIIPSTPEDAQMISKYLKKKPWNLPSIVEDSLFLIKDPKTGKDKVTGKALWGLFPHIGNPYEVWIDENGKVLATTRHQEVNATNIQNYLNTGKLNVKTSNGDVGRAFNMDKDLLVDGNGGMENGYIMRSILTGELNLGGASGIFEKHYSVSKEHLFVKSMVGLNYPSWYYFRMVWYSKSRRSNFVSNIYLENNNKITFLGNCTSSHEAFDRLKRFTGYEKYCYNFTAPPPGVIDTLFYNQYMLEDLNRYFDFIVRIEKRKIPCFVVSNLNNRIDFLAQVSDTTLFQYNFSSKIDKEYFQGVKNLPMKDFISYLASNYFMSPPIFNETGFVNERVNLNFNLKYGHNNNDDAIFQVPNLAEWRAALQRNGLDIKVEDREVEVMVFKKKETPSK